MILVSYRCATVAACGGFPGEFCKILVHGLGGNDACLASVVDASRGRERLDSRIRHAACVTDGARAARGQPRLPRARELCGKLGYGPRPGQPALRRTWPGRRARRPTLRARASASRYRGVSCAPAHRRRSRVARRGAARGRRVAPSNLNSERETARVSRAATRRRPFKLAQDRLARSRRTLPYTTGTAPVGALNTTRWCALPHAAGTPAPEPVLRGSRDC